MAQEVLVQLNPGVTGGSGDVVIRPTALQLARQKTAGKLRNHWAVEYNLATDGTWTDYVNGQVLTPAAAGVRGTLTAGAGPNGRPALVLGTATNPGILHAPSAATYWRADQDWSAVAVLHPGSVQAAGKAILTAPGYDGIPFCAMSTAYRLQFDFDVSAGGSAGTDPDVVGATRWYVVTWAWDASAQRMYFRVGAQSWVAGAVQTDVPSVSRLALFGGQEQPPELSPGNPRIRLPARDVKVADILWFDADLHDDSALWAVMWAHFTATVPSATAP